MKVNFPWIGKKTFQTVLKGQRASKIKVMPEYESNVEYIENLSTITRDFSKMFGTDTNKYIPERFTDYDSIVEQLRLRYNGLADVGNHLVKILVDTRANYISNAGIQIDAKRPKEKKWISQFMEFNDFEAIGFKQAVIAGELDGKCLFQLVPDETIDGKPQVRINRINYGTRKYTVNVDAEKFNKITGVDVHGETKSYQLKPSEVVYVKLSGTDDKINETVPRLGTILYLIDSVDYATRDFRVVNSKYANMSIFFETADANNAADLVLAMKKSNWQIGQSLAGPAKAYFVEPEGTGLNNLNKEIINAIEQISGISGVSPTLLGFVELFRNKSTPESLQEQQYTTTMLERSFWKVKMKELIQKAMLMSNEKHGTTLDPTQFDVQIPVNTMQGLDLVKNIYLPLNQAGKISDRYLVNKLPDTDYETQLEWIKQEEKERPQPEPKQEESNNSPALPSAIEENESVNQPNQETEQNNDQ